MDNNQPYDTAMKGPISGESFLAAKLRSDAQMLQASFSVVHPLRPLQINLNL